jgi:hypothetical protein
VGGEARTYYFQGGAATNFVPTATDTSGTGGILDVTPGVVTVTATPVGSSKATSSAHVYVRQGTLTTVFLLPTR